MWLMVKNYENETVFVNLDNVVMFDVEAETLFLNTLNNDRNGILNLSSDFSKELAKEFEKITKDGMIHIENLEMG